MFWTLNSNLCPKRRNQNNLSMMTLLRLWRNFKRSYSNYQRRSIRCRQQNARIDLRGLPILVIFEISMVRSLANFSLQTQAKQTQVRVEDVRSLEWLVSDLEASPHAEYRDPWEGVETDDMLQRIHNRAAALIHQRRIFDLSFWTQEAQMSSYNAEEARRLVSLHPFRPPAHFPLKRTNIFFNILQQRQKRM